MNNEIPSYTIYEDEVVKVFLDVNPDANGHMLVVPKKHITDFLEMDDTTLIHIHEVAKKMGELAYDKLNCDGLKLVNNHGITQMVKHYHLHIIPVYKEDNGINQLEDTYKLLTK